jgi:TPR repeat protein
MYLDGTVVPASESEAAVWFERAIDQGGAAAFGELVGDSAVVRRLADGGMSEAQFHVGQTYASGAGVPKSGGEAVRWFELAAEGGLLEAQRMLGHVFADGRIVAQDFPRALRWFTLCAERGDPECQYEVGVFHAAGQGVARDLVKGHMWLNIAAAQNYEQARLRRDDAADRMTRDQIDRAQKLAVDWMAARRDDAPRSAGTEGP